MSDNVVPLATGRMLKIKDVVEQTSLDRATIYRMIDRGEFPRQRRISKQRVAWREAEVEAWKQGRPFTS